MNEDIVVIIPAYNPDEKFISFLDDLYTGGGYKKLIVVDDGSCQERKKYFEIAKIKYGCDIINHSINLGQGRAFKSAFNFFLEKYADSNIIGIVECDCDGQHLLNDVDNCCKKLRENPHSFILGVRSFNNNNVPIRSRFGNICTSLVFKLFCGLNIKDTQSGLKAIPKEYVKLFIETPGERFEYATSVLLDTKKYGIEIIQVPISTVYIDNNTTSHFNPVVDSIRIYSLILKYLVSSLSASIIDLLFFSLFIISTKNLMEQYIILSTYFAKIISCTYSYLVNKNIVFNNKAKHKDIAVKWVILCLIQATLSGMLTTIICNNFMSLEILIKIFVDVILFFLSFQIQNRWVFRN